MTNPVFITKNGTIERHENTIYFENEFQKTPLPLEQVDEIYCTSHVTVTSGAIHILAMREIPIHFFNHYGYYESSLWPRKRAVSGNITVLQVKSYLDAQTRFRLASSFVMGSALNITNVLKIQQRNGPDFGVFTNRITSLLNEIPNVSPSIQELMGIEGNIRKLYYEAIDMILPEWLRLGRREFHPPTNPGNAAMSFLNSLIYSSSLTQIYFTQLDPTISYLHEPGTRRFSLSLDIAEIFKPAISDRIFLKLSNRNELKKEHFDNDLGSTVLSEAGRRFMLKSYQEKIESTVMHRSLKRKVTYRTLMRLEAYKILNDILIQKPYKPLLAWW